MRRLLPVFILFLGGLGCSRSAPETPTRGSLTALSSEGIAPLILREAAEFHRAYASTNITVLPTTTREAIVYLFRDSVTAIAVDRGLNPEERSVLATARAAVVETKFGTDALALLVNSSNGVSVMTMETLKEILTGNLSSWDHIRGSGQRGPIELVMTGRNSGIYELLSTQFFALAELPRPTVAADSQRQVIAEVSRNRRAIGIASFSYLNAMKRESNDLSAIRILGMATADSTIKLTQYSVYQGSYPLSHPLFLYTKEREAGPAAGFATFLTSYDGQKIVQTLGIVPVRIPARAVQLTEE